MEQIPLNKIMNVSNRKYTRDDSFQQLINSIQDIGILEPPLVRRLPDGMFRVAAGRRRVAAAEKLGLYNIDCIVLEQDYPADDEEIALIENVNRLELHPLDEAAAFTRMYEKGTAVEDIAKYYARSPSAIYKRLRLAGLTENLKEMFREGVLKISGAAILAELPEEDQEKFYKKNETTKEVAAWAVTDFVLKSQKLRLYEYLGEECGECKNRTHNKDSSLFEAEYAFTHDVCLDGACYREKWHGLIEKALEEKIQNEAPSELKVRFDGIPEKLYKKADQVTFSGNRYDVLRDNEWRFTGETNRKKKTCWEIGATYDGITITRIGYEKQEKPSDENKYENKYEKQYKAELTEIGQELGRSTGELAGKLEGKYKQPYQFTQELDNRITNRLLEAYEAEEPRDYAAAYFRAEFRDEFCEEGEERRGIWYHGEERTDLFKKITGFSTVEELRIPAAVQKVFKFLNYLEMEDETVPSLDSVDEPYNKYFFELFSVDKEEFKKIYLETFNDLVKEVAADVDVEEGEDGSGDETEEEAD